MKLYTTFAVAMFLLATDGRAEEVQVTPVVNDDAKSFLEALAGDYRGRGTVIAGLGKSEERVSCKLNNAFDPAVSELSIMGRCATTQGRVEVDGSLKVQEEGNIAGTFLSTSNDSEVTQSSGSLVDGTLTLSMSMVSKSTGDLKRTRQVVSHTSDDGFVSVFYRYDNASQSYQKTGTVNFSRSSTQTN